jgi:lipopolysaccharide/colanic/teichoic acid biosynthesis glycosyltransferase
MEVKYAAERVLAILFLILTSPLFLTVALFILLDGFLHPENRGSIFYLEPRYSAGKVFKLIKFRTVPEQVVRWIREDAKSRSITTSREQTWAGKWILRWYLDELPQLVNIVRSEMSFVGPRPHTWVMHHSEVEQGCLYRDHLKAGLLGIPQACKQLPSAQKMFEAKGRAHESEIGALNTLDGLYAKECLERSLWGIVLYDLWIVWKGLVVVARGQGNRPL